MKIHVLVMCCLKHVNMLQMMIKFLMGLRQISVKGAQIGLQKIIIWTKVERRQ